MEIKLATKNITVLLAEDHTIVREGLRTLINSEKDIKVVSEASTGRQAVELAQKLRPAVVIMDIAMPVLNGLEATRQICIKVPDTKVLILSAHSDEAYVEQVIAVGAKGYLLKQTSARFLSEAIREVQKGNTYFSPSLVRKFTQFSLPLNHQEKQRQKACHLSSREVEVLQLIAEGQANKQVAAELGISVKTVEKHRQRLMEKLKIHDTASLTRYAISSGIIESSVQLTIL